jgi:hypothetical protein
MRRDIIIAGIFFIFGAAIGYFAPISYDWWKQPRLTLATDPVIEENDYWRLQVLNKGRSAATDCKGKITLDIEVADVVDKLENIVNDVTQENFLPLQGARLSWVDSRKPVTTIDPRTKMPQKLELFRVWSRPSKPEFFINIPREEGYWQHYPNTFCRITLRTQDSKGNARAYHGTLEISAENVLNPIKKEFYLRPLLDEKKVELQWTDEH